MRYRSSPQRSDRSSGLSPLVFLIAGLSLTIFPGCGAGGGPTIGDLVGRLLPFIAAPQAPPDPTEAPRLLEQAEGLFRDGHLTEAREALQVLLGRHPRSAQVEGGLYLLGQTAAEEGDMVAAAEAFEQYLAGYPEGAHVLGATFRLGEALAAQGRVDEAVAHYRAVMERAPAVAANVGLEIVSLLLSAGRDAEALAEAGEMLPVAEAAGLGAPGGELRAVALERQGRLEEALAHYRRRAVAASDGERPALDSATARLLEAMGQRDRAAELRHGIVLRYPRSGQAREALDWLQQAGLVGANDYQQALVRYFAWQTSEAIRLLQSYLSGRQGDALFPEARYRLGLAYDRLGEEEEAVVQFLWVANAWPTHPLAADALWDAALALERLERYADAAATYRRLAAGYPGSEWAAGAPFREGLARYRLGDPPQAVSLWQGALARPGYTRSARYWLARTRWEMGQEAAAREQAMALLAEPWRDYYTVRARDLLGMSSHLTALPAEDQGSLEDPEELHLQAVEWLATWTEPSEEGWALPPRVLEDAGFQRAGLLLQIGLRSAAQRDLHDLHRRLARDPRALLVLAEHEQRLGLHQLAIGAAQTVLDRSPDSFYEAPPLLRMLLYPRHYVHLVAPESASRGLDPYLLLALIWQESLFEPAARSGANALGLTQVIPDTAETLARSLGVAPFAHGDLARPYMSVRFGAQYLAAQLRGFDGSPLFALAAYNGGPGNARRWLKSNPRRDPDLFVEDIDFAETRS
ncbi:MAG: transglycosylase SLT domain-containing protein, partial [Chloroflexi bacterium]|nr:transglycosylase SLT domain-containing protein [Chloroflexota bacterium]